MASHSNLFVKWLNDAALQPILDILNECWEADIMPSSLESVDVVTLYKKGNVEDPQHIDQSHYYRPYTKYMQAFYKQGY